MKNLRKKTFYTIFIIISLFGIFFAFLFNIQTYHQQYMGIRSSITRMKKVFDDDRIPKEERKKKDDIQNRLILDYQVYTFILDKN